MILNKKLKKQNYSIYINMKNYNLHKSYQVITTLENNPRAWDFAILEI